MKNYTSSFLTKLSELHLYFVNYFWLLSFYLFLAFYLFLFLIEPVSGIRGFLGICCFCLSCYFLTTTVQNIPLWSFCFCKAASNMLSFVFNFNNLSLFFFINETKFCQCFPFVFVETGSSYSTIEFEFFFMYFSHPFVRYLFFKYSL